MNTKSGYSVSNLLTKLVLIFVFSSVGSAITIRHDREDKRYLELGRQFTSVCTLGRAGDGTLIASQWIVTAAHVANGVKNRGNIKAKCGNSEYEIEQVFIHPEWVDMGPHDIALLKLKKPVEDAKPMAVYTNTDELSQIATIVGHGDTRTGNGGEWINDGKLRAATSKIDRADKQWIYLTFDEPPNATDLEGAPGRGDSGGPAILFIKNMPYVAGISSLGTDGKNGPATYGAEDSFVRISSYKAWMFSVMNVRSFADVKLPASKPESSAKPEKHSPSEKKLELPDTPQGKIVTHYIEAFSSGKPEKMKDFFTANLSEESLRRRPIDARLQVYREMFDNLGGIELKEVVSVGAKNISILTKRSKGEWQKFDFEFTSQPPYKLDGVANQSVEPR